MCGEGHCCSGASRVCVCGLISTRMLLFLLSASPCHPKGKYVPSISHYILQAKAQAEGGIRKIRHARHIG